jgi:hypothetical protein
MENIDPDTLIIVKDEKGNYVGAVQEKDLEEFASIWQLQQEAHYKLTAGGTNATT